MNLPTDLAVKRWGGEVHEMGIMLLVFMPLPYVDASSSSVFRDKHKRMLVGAAGILTELFLAAIATFVWFAVETGTVRDIAYDVMLIGGISTLLFNGNPLLRFDGYYVLADAIEIPNLAQRANRYYGYLIQRYLFARADVSSPVSAPGERSWFLFYGPASAVYRLFILATIVLFLAEEYLVAGVLLGLVAVILQIVVPLCQADSVRSEQPRSAQPASAGGWRAERHDRHRSLWSCSMFPYRIDLCPGHCLAARACPGARQADGFIEQILAHPQTEVHRVLP